MYETSSTVSWLRTSQSEPARTAVLPMTMAAFARLLLYIFSMKHDDGDRRAHEQRHPQAGLAEEHMIEGIGIEVHQGEHHDR